MGPAPSQRSLRENPSTQPCTLNPNGFNLSWPSICQMKFGPFVRYARRRNLFFRLVSIPSGLSSFREVVTLALLTIIPLFLILAYILRYPTKQPLLPSSFSMALLSSSPEMLVFLNNPKEVSLHFRVDKLMLTPWSLRNSSIYRLL